MVKRLSVLPTPIKWTNMPLSDCSGQPPQTLCYLKIYTLRSALFLSPWPHRACFIHSILQFTYRLYSWNVMVLQQCQHSSAYVIVSIIFDILKAERATLSDTNFEKLIIHEGEWRQWKRRTSHNDWISCASRIEKKSNYFFKNFVLLIE